MPVPVCHETISFNGADRQLILSDINSFEDLNASPPFGTSVMSPYLKNLVTQNLKSNFKMESLDAINVNISMRL